MLGFETLTEIAFGQKDTGIQQVTDTIDASAHSQQLDSKDCRDWVISVLASWEEQAASFRHGMRAAGPSFAEAVQANALHLQFSSFVAAAGRLGPFTHGAAASSVAATPPRPPTADRAAPGAPKKSRKQRKKEAPAPNAPARAQAGAPARGAGGQAGGAAGNHNPARSALWPNRPDFAPAKWREVQADCRARFPEYCTFYLCSQCVRMDRNGHCPFKHEKPEGFDDFTARHGDGIAH